MGRGPTEAITFHSGYKTTCDARPVGHLSTQLI
jgi:hypothetical protein